MGVLQQGEDDVGLGVVGVESLVVGGVVILQDDYAVLCLADFKVLAVLVLAHDEGLVAACGSVSGRVDMDGDEEVGVVLVGYVGPAVQLYETVIAAGVDDIYRRIIALYQVPEASGDGEGDVFFIYFPVDGSGVMAAVTGVYNDCP